MALIGRPKTKRIPAHMKRTESSETRVTSEKSLFGSTSGIVSNAQILQSFLGFYVFELCDWALR